MRSRFLLWLVVSLVAAVATAADDLVPLSDEFSNASTLSNWQRVYLVEGWNANQLELQNINTTQSGRMVLEPCTSTWYNDYRGELTFKSVQGDFVVTTDVTASNRAGNAAPASLFSLGGIMLRAPRQITPQTWTPGGENYLFLSLGAADVASTFKFEVKSTTSSNSVLFLTPAPSGHSLIQWARIGPYFIALENSSGSWVVHRRYYRPDLPAILQVGMTTYTDYPYCAANYTPLQHNSTPDLVAAFDYFRYERPVVPSSLAGSDLTNTTTVPDSELLSFLGANARANHAGIAQQPADVTAVRGTAAVFTVAGAGEEPVSYQWSKGLSTLIGQTSPTLMLSNVQSTDAGDYSVTVSNSIDSVTSRNARLTVILPAPASVVATASGATSVMVSWSPVTDAVSYQVVRSDDATTFIPAAGTPAGNTLTDTGAAADTAYLYKVRAVDASNVAGAYSVADLATTVIFTDAPFGNDATMVKAVHIDELRTAVNAVRKLASRTTATFSDPTITPGVTTIQADHLMQLRSNLDEALAALFLPQGSYADPTIMAGSKAVMAVHFTELQNAVK